MGSEATASNTWLWSWANKASHFPEPLMLAACQIQKYGQEHGVPEFTAPELEIGEISGHLLSMIASGLCQADAYYRGPYNGGAVFLLLTAPQLRQQADDSPLRFIRIFNEFIMAFSCRHRDALAAYARCKGYPTEDGENALVTTFPQGAQVRATFDAQGRLAEMTSTITPENTGAQPEKKPWWKLGK